MATGGTDAAGALTPVARSPPGADPAIHFNRVFFFFLKIQIVPIDIYYDYPI